MTQALEALGGFHPPDRGERVRETGQLLQPPSGAAPRASGVAGTFGREGGIAQLLHLAQRATRPSLASFRRLVGMVISTHTKRLRVAGLWQDQVGSRKGYIFEKTYRCQQVLRQQNSLLQEEDVMHSNASNVPSALLTHNCPVKLANPLSIAAPFLAVFAPLSITGTDHKKMLEPGKRSSSETGGTKNTPPARTLSRRSIPGSGLSVSPPKFVPPSQPSWVSIR